MTASPTPAGGIKWCKAIWYKKGRNGKTETEAIPQSGISKSRCTVKWPPKDQNFKRAIENCSAPTNYWTKVYTLRRCTKSVNTLAEAQQLQTESSDSGASEDLYTDDEQMETPCMESAIRKGPQRKETILHPGAVTNLWWQRRAGK